MNTPKVLTIIRTAFIIGGALAIAWLSVGVASAQAYPGGWSYYPSAWTDPRAQTGDLSAKVQGTLNPHGSVPYFWFEYGPTPSLGLRTPGGTFDAANYDASVAEIINVNRAGTYYYRFVVQNSVGIAYGSTEKFVATGGAGDSSAVGSGNGSDSGIANSNDSAGSDSYSAKSAAVKKSKTKTASNSVATQNARQAAIQNARANSAGNSSAGNNSSVGFAAWLSGVLGNGTGNDNSASAVSACALVTPQSLGGKLVAGEEVAYRIRYQNNCQSDLKAAELAVELPVGVRLTGTDKEFRMDGNTVTYVMGDLKSGATGSVALRGVIERKVQKQDELMLAATLSFISQGEMQAVAAIITTPINGGSVQTASVWSTLQGLFTRWLIALLLILVILGLAAYILLEHRKTGNGKHQFVVV